MVQHKFTNSMQSNIDLDAVVRLRAVTPLVPTAELAINRIMDQGQIALPDTPEPSASEVHDTLLRTLIGRMARRDETALAAFYDATAARTYALARRITRESAAAEEVISDVYFQVWQQAERFDPARGRALAWVLMMCRTRALDHLRRLPPVERHPAPDGLRPDLYRDDNDPLELLLALERDSRVLAAVTTLSDNARRLLALAFFQGLSHQEIADHTGLPLGTVKSSLRRAMQELKQLLENAPVSLESSA